MATVLKRPQALRDLVEIWAFIADDSEAQADRFLAGLDAALKGLAAEPLMGRLRPELMVNLRSLPHGRYVVFYLPLDHGIDVVRVLHSARDLAGQHFPPH